MLHLELCTKRHHTTRTGRNHEGSVCIVRHIEQRAPGNQLQEPLFCGDASPELARGIEMND